MAVNLHIKKDEENTSVRYVLQHLRHCTQDDPSQNTVAQRQGRKKSPQRSRTVLQPLEFLFIRGFVRTDETLSLPFKQHSDGGSRLEIAKSEATRTRRSVSCRFFGTSFLHSSVPKNYSN